VFVSFIHGGAWRDPAVGSRSFEPAVRALWKSSTQTALAGLASINYRLSPYPSHQDDPSSPDDPARNVHHPSHVSDVAQALVYLDQKYNIAQRYLLVGHSAGATIAFQLSNSYLAEDSLPRALGILGIAGIYHFEAFLEAHSGISAYKEIMENAFPDKRLWDEACPYTNHIPEVAWHRTGEVIISASREDQLVEWAQSTLMIQRVQEDLPFLGKLRVLEASGGHDEIWASGYILADLITKSLQILQSTAPA